MTFTKHMLLGGAAVLLIAGNASAEEFNASAFEAQDFVGTVEIIVENRSGIDITTTGSSEFSDQIVLNTNGTRVELTYDDPRAVRRAWNNYSNRGWGFWRNETEDRLAEFPHVVVRVPAGTPVDMDGMAGRIDADDLDSDFVLGTNGSMKATIGNVMSATVNTAGSGEIQFGNVAHSLTVRIAGSADVAAEDVQTLAVRSQGSGDVRVDRVAQDLDFQSQGSGDLQARAANGVIALHMQGSGDARIDEGTAELFVAELRGSGDARFDGLAQEARIEVGGSGGVRLHELQGPADLETHGSGDITIEEGRSEGFAARAYGSGDIYFGGTAMEADISSHGSGDVTIEDYHGRYRRTG